MLSRVRRLLKIIHPEGIPWPGTVIYNVISETRIFQGHYELVAEDILSYCSQGSILDIGTGPGWLLVRLHQKARGLRLTGLDVSPSMIGKARKNMADLGLSDVIEVKVGSASNMPFPECTFDAIVSTGSIHHWKEPTAGLNDVYRVLKDGGYALMYDLVSDTPASVLKETARQFGKLKMVLLWLHAFEEPFYSREDFGLLPRGTLFREGRTRFVGVMCCLVLRKTAS